MGCSPDLWEGGVRLVDNTVWYESYCRRFDRAFWLYRSVCFLCTPSDAPDSSQKFAISTFARFMAGCRRRRAMFRINTSIETFECGSLDPALPNAPLTVRCSGRVSSFERGLSLDKKSKSTSIYFQNGSFPLSSLRSSLPVQHSLRKTGANNSLASG